MYLKVKQMLSLVHANIDHFYDTSRSRLFGMHAAAAAAGRPPTALCGAMVAATAATLSVIHILLDDWGWGDAGVCASPRPAASPPAVPPPVQYM